MAVTSILDSGETLPHNPGPCNIVLPELERLVNHHRPIASRRYLYPVGAHLQALFLIRSGALKSVQTLAAGQERIVRFHFAGDIVGSDAIAFGRHPTSCIALQPTTVGCIPMTRQAAGGALVRLMSLEMLDMRATRHAMVGVSAEKRLARFMLNLCQRTGNAQGDRYHLLLPMTRQDIANHLGMSAETTSRLFNEFSRRGYIAFQGRSITLLNRARLQAVAEQKLN